jgi:hypothetical protein
MFIAENDIAGDLLELRSSSGEKAISSSVNLNEMRKCKFACKENYYVEMPIILPIPPRNNNLGKDVNNPGASCADIVKWGE